MTLRELAKRDRPNVISLSDAVAVLLIESTREIRYDAAARDYIHTLWVMVVNESPLLWADPRFDRMAWRFRHFHAMARIKRLRDLVLYDSARITRLLGDGNIAREVQGHRGMELARRAFADLANYLNDLANHLKELEARLVACG